MADEENPLVEFSRKIGAQPLSSHVIVHRIRQSLQGFPPLLKPFAVASLLWLVLLGPLYRHSLSTHGTFAPWNVMKYSKAFEPEHPFPTGGPPDGWKPTQRVVVTLTTMPHQVKNLIDTLDSLAFGQSIAINSIYVNLPERMKRTGAPYVVSDDLIKRYEHTSIKFHRTEKDYGPLTKLFPALQAEDDPKTIIITVDSDKIYPFDAIRTLAWYSEHQPDTAWGICGWRFFWTEPPMSVLPLYIPWLMRGSYGREVDVMQACCGNAYRRGFFKHLDLLEEPPKQCFTTDDIWISGYLATVARVRRVIIPGATSSLTSLEPSQPVSLFFILRKLIINRQAWKATDDKSLQLSTHNSQEGVDIGCIKAIHDKLGPWINLREVDDRTQGKLMPINEAISTWNAHLAPEEK